MSKVVETSTSRASSRPKRTSRTRPVGVGETSPKATANAKRVRSGSVGKAKFEAVMKAAENSGLMTEKSSRIGGRVSAMLIQRAKKQTGIESDTDLIEFALANVAIADDFSKVFKQSRGKVDPTLKLGF